MRKYASKKQEILMTIREHLGNTTHYYTTPTEENILELIVNRHGISQNVGKHLIEKSKIELSLINKLPILSDYKSLTNNYPNRIDQHVCTNDSCNLGTYAMSEWLLYLKKIAHVNYSLTMDFIILSECPMCFKKSWIHVNHHLLYEWLNFWIIPPTDLINRIVEITKKHNPEASF